MNRIRTTVVGSYPVPDWLKASPSPAALTDAIRLVLDTQKRAGIDVIGDGELGRWDLARREPAGMVERFVRPMAGVRYGLTRKQRDAFLADPTTAYRANAPGVVIDELGDGDLDLLRDFEQAKALMNVARLPQSRTRALSTEGSRATLGLKFTLTSPYMLAKVVVDDHYRDIERLTMAFAEVLAGQMKGIDAAVIQIDEPHLPGYPDHGSLAAMAINHVLNATEEGVSRAVHLCFGNFGGQMIQQGDYRKLIEFVNALDCDHIVAETTRRTQGEIEALKDIDDRIGLGVGVIDVKDLQVETPEVVAARIERLADLLGVERLHYVHPDCGLQVLPRAIADRKLHSLVAGRDLFEGRWDGHSCPSFISIADRKSATHRGVRPT